jgi:hypothetical protein
VSSTDRYFHMARHDRAGNTRQLREQGYGQQTLSFDNCSVRTVMSISATPEH